MVVRATLTSDAFTLCGDVTVDPELAVVRVWGYNVVGTGSSEVRVTFVVGESVDDMVSVGIDRL